MIEKRINYQEGNGVGSPDPLQIIVFLMGKRASPGGLTSAEEKELDRLIEKTGYMSQKKAKGGKIEKPRPKPTYLNGNVIDLHPYLNDPYWEIETPKTNDDESKFSREGIMRLVGLEDDMDREFYGGLLSPIYGADYIESLPIPKLKELFNEYLRNMEIS